MIEFQDFNSFVYNLKGQTQNLHLSYIIIINIARVLIFKCIKGKNIAKLKAMNEFQEYWEYLQEINT